MLFEINVVVIISFISIVTFYSILLSMTIFYNVQNMYRYTNTLNSVDLIPSEFPGSPCKVETMKNISTVESLFSVAG